MKKIAALLSVAALGLSMFSLAHADDYYHHSRLGYGAGPEGFGPQGFAPTSIAQVRQSAYDDQIVVLNGRLTNYLGNDHYEFSDGTGVIEVDLDDDYDWSFISKDQLIQLTAEVDRDFLSVTLDAIRAVPLEKAPVQSVHTYQAAQSAPAVQAAPATQVAPAVQAAPATQAAPTVQATQSAPVVK